MLDALHLLFVFLVKYIVRSFVVMKGLYSHKPARSCMDIQDSGDSRGDGEYWIDPEKSGNPLKVFCDMKTDGGKWWWQYQAKW